jgi:hypothetical protein
MASELAFKQDGEQTVVTWAMAGHHDFIEKAFCLVMNGTKMVGDAGEGPGATENGGGVRQERLARLTRRPNISALRSRGRPAAC